MDQSRHEETTAPEGYPDENFVWRIENDAWVAIASWRGFFVPFEEAGEYFGARLLVDVDTRRLDHQLVGQLSNVGRQIEPGDWFIGAGDWSRWLRPIDGLDVDIEVAEVIEANLRYGETAKYREFIEALEAGVPRQRNHVVLNSPEKVDAYFSHTARLIESIKRHGVQSRAAVSGGGSSDETHLARPAWLELAERDVGVAIDRDGSLRRVRSGQHRTAIARHLGITRMPAEIRTVHAGWLWRVMRERKLEPLAAIELTLRWLGEGLDLPAALGQDEILDTSA